MKASILANQIPDCLNYDTKQDCMVCATTLIKSVENGLDNEKKKLFKEKVNQIQI